MSRKNNTSRETIPVYILEDFKEVHRHDDTGTGFGYNSIEEDKKINGFEIYSSAGVKPVIGPLKSDFYRVCITIHGTADTQIGLEEFHHVPSSISTTYPGQLYSKSNVSKDISGYYILFKETFLEEMIPADKIAAEFPFFDYAGVPFLELKEEEMKAITDFIFRINEELHQQKTGNGKAIRMHLYLLLLEIKRSYLAQQLHVDARDTQHYLPARFKKLVSRHFLTQRKVSDYAAMLGVTPNHLNRIVKDSTGRTASAAISDMLIQEAKAVLRHTDTTISEIAYRLDFSDPTSFNRFFREKTGITPLAFRKNA
ncbi:MAG TPA: AraC family transcriptional regulator [Chitinophaga sp.]|uniref:helix-turn-helix domain-containing protein n=1 Tax=Chitinophaga sp. TaxID=1869181 RepID=UPI002BB9B700|nr:AraC family transcriptional regulator [Chitinophaga sp.]HVI43360.1 AraC family transcriptional regulator [Chitinophaga sp.]